jgi:hypothetical protein
MASSSACSPSSTPRGHSRKCCSPIRWCRKYCAQAIRCRCRIAQSLAPCRHAPRLTSEATSTARRQYVSRLQNRMLRQNNGFPRAKLARYVRCAALAVRSTKPDSPDTGSPSYTYTPLRGRLTTLQRLYTLLARP